MKAAYLFPALLLTLALCACAPPLSEPPPSDTPPDLEAQSGAPQNTAPEQIPLEIPQEIPADDAFVRVQDYLPGLYVDLKYATEDNFTGAVIYDFSDAYLRYGTVKKLEAVLDTLSADGYSLLIWDAFRPTEAQFKLWEICPDPVYVSDPNKGFSSHSRGNTVDLTLVHTDGSAVDMPTGFDDFSPLADRDYSDVPSPAAEHAQYLEQVMEDHGFRPYSGEWWHFSDTDSYEVDESFLSER